MIQGLSSGQREMWTLAPLTGARPETGATDSGAGRLASRDRHAYLGDPS